MADCVLTLSVDMKVPFASPSATPSVPPWLDSYSTSSKRRAHPLWTDTTPFPLWIPNMWSSLRGMRGLLLTEKREPRRPDAMQQGASNTIDRRIRHPPSWGKLMRADPDPYGRSDGSPVLDWSRLVPRSRIPTGSRCVCNGQVVYWPSREMGWEWAWGTRMPAVHVPSPRKLGTVRGCVLLQFWLSYFPPGRSAGRLRTMFDSFYSITKWRPQASRSIAITSDRTYECCKTYAAQVLDTGRG